MLEYEVRQGRGDHIKVIQKSTIDTFENLMKQIDDEGCYVSLCTPNDNGSIELRVSCSETRPWLGNLTYVISDTSGHDLWNEWLRFAELVDD